MTKKKVKMYLCVVCNNMVGTLEDETPTCSQCDELSKGLIKMDEQMTVTYNGDEDG